MNVIALALAVIQPLWPEGRIPDFQESQVAAPSEEMSKPGFDRAAHRMPYLEWSENPANPNGACVILISGGAYQCTCDRPAMRHLEAELLSNGVACVWLWYRTPRNARPGEPFYLNAWQDGQRAVRLVRAAATARGFDPERIGALGASAGGHLTVLLGTMSQTNVYARVDATDDVPAHLNFALPICPAYLLTDGLVDGRNARGGEWTEAKIDPAIAFDAKTCPMCLFHGGADEVSPLGSTQVYRQLRRMRIPAELHIDPDRGHGAPSARNFVRAVEFLRQMGFLGPLAPAEDLMKRYPGNDARGEYAKESVWPEGKMPDAQDNQCEPYLEWHLPKELKTKAIQIIYSGGSYTGNSPDGHEVAPARRFLNAHGMTVVTMKYRTPRPQGLRKHVTAWQDLQRAIRIVRAEAPKRGLDPDRIGIMGSSAGGHLTLMGATSSKSRSYRPIDALDRLPCNVQWAVAIYPAYSLTDGGENPNAKGGNEDDARPVPEFSFDLATCPILFIHGDADCWASMNSVKCWEQLRRMGIQGELHTLCKRGHCFQFKASPGTGSYTWLERIWDFMTVKGFNR